MIRRIISVVLIVIFPLVVVGKDYQFEEIGTKPSILGRIVFLKKGQVVPYDGILLKPDDAAKLVASYETMEKEVQEDIRWGWEVKKAIKKEDKLICQAQIKDVETTYKNAIKKQKKQTQKALILYVVLSIGMLGLGVGLGVYLGKRYK